MPPINHPKHPRSHARYRIHLDELSHDAVPEFTKIPDLAHVLQNAVDQVFEHLYKPFGNPQAVRSITLVLRSLDGVAYTTGIELDEMHKEIHLSLEHINHFVDDQARFRAECVGVITHEMVHCWQHNCKGTAPGGLIEGIADFVRLKAGLSPPHWQKTKPTPSNKWDEGYQKTAYFLEWLEETHGKGSISKMNAHMEGHAYHEEHFWRGLFGETVQTLWSKYVKHWDEDDSKTPPSLASTEPELVDLTDEEKEAVGKGTQVVMQAKKFDA